MQMGEALVGEALEMIILDDITSFGSQLSDTKYQFPVAANCQGILYFVDWTGVDCTAVRCGFVKRGFAKRKLVKQAL